MWQNLNNVNKHKRRLASVLVFSVCLAAILVLSTDISFASGSHWTGTNWDLTEFASQVREIYRIMLNVVVPCAAVVFAYGAFRLLMGDQQEASKGKATMKYALIAIAVIYLTPTIISVGIRLGSTYGWHP